MPNTRAPECRLGDAVAVRDHLARELEPGDVGGRTRRRLVEAGALHQVGAVEPGAVHAHEDLTGPRFGIGTFLDPHLLVGDHERAHGSDGSNDAAGPARAPALRCGRARRRPLARCPGRPGRRSMPTARRCCSTPPRRATSSRSPAGSRTRRCRRARACRSRILAVVALIDLLDDAPPFARSGELVELADDAPTLHVYVRDLGYRCTAPRMARPGRGGVGRPDGPARGPAIIR